MASRSRAITRSSSKSSIVRTRHPSAATARVMHDRAGAPSTTTVQAPHTPVLAAEVGAGEAEPLAQEVGERQPRRHIGGDALAVDRQRDRGHASACRAARASATLWSCSA